MPEIGEQPIGNVERRMDEARLAKRDAKLQTWLREAVALDERGGRLMVERRQLAAQAAQAERAVAERATHPDPVARLRAAAQHGRSSPDTAERSDRQRQRPGRPGRVAAEESDPEL